MERALEYVMVVLLSLTDNSKSGYIGMLNDVTIYDRKEFPIGKFYKQLKQLLLYSNFVNKKI